MSISVSRGFRLLAFILSVCVAAGVAYGEGSNSKAKTVKATVVGMVHVTEGNASGKPNKIIHVEVATAQDESGRVIDGLAGSRLRVVGAKSSKVEKFSGKEAILTGKLGANKEFKVDKVVAKPVDFEGSDKK